MTTTMSIVGQAEGGAVRHCESLQIDWRAPDAAPQVGTVDGEHLSISIAVFRQGQQSEAAPQPQGEEVATVLEGVFLVEAAGERYELVPGEGIIIPPREPRSWTCQSERGALYRVLVSLDNPAPAPASTPAQGKAA